MFIDILIENMGWENLYLLYLWQVLSIVNILIESLYYHALYISMSAF